MRRGSVALAVAAMMLASLAIHAAPAVADSACTVEVRLQFVNGPKPKAVTIGDCVGYHSMAVWVTLYRVPNNGDPWVAVGDDYKEAWFTEHIVTNYVRESACGSGTRWVASGRLMAYDLPAPDATPHNLTDTSAIKTCP